MHQSRGLERLAGLLLGQPLGGQLAQLLVDQRAIAARPPAGRPARLPTRMRVTSSRQPPPTLPQRAVTDPDPSGSRRLAHPGRHACGDDSTPVLTGAS